MENNKLEILLTAFTKEDFTDERIISFRQQHDDFTFKEYSALLNSITIFNNNSQRIIDFLAHYQNGCLCPQKCDAYEPLKEIFNPDDISAPVKWLSQPGGAFYCKRRRTRFKCDGAIENRRSRPIWERIDKKNQKLLKPIVPEPEFLGEIKLWFNKKDLLNHEKGIPFIEEILNEIDKIVKISKHTIVQLEMSGFF